MRTKEGNRVAYHGDRNEQSHPVPFKGPGQEDRTNCGSANSNCGAGILWINCFFNGKRDMEIASLFEKGNYNTVYWQYKLFLI